jgi:hypothetical protein
MFRMKKFPDDGYDTMSMRQFHLMLIPYTILVNRRCAVALSRRRLVEAVPEALSRRRLVEAVPDESSA